MRNLSTLLATSAANFILVIGRRLPVKSAMGICEDCKIDIDPTGTADLTFDCQGGHPSGLEGKLVRVGNHRMPTQNLTCNRNMI